MSRSYWRPQAVKAIEIADSLVPAGASMKERMAIIDAAYPFQERQYFPYKIWLSERRKYISRHDGSPINLPKHLSPLERAKAAYEKMEVKP